MRWIYLLEQHVGTEFLVPFRHLKIVNEDVFLLGRDGFDGDVLLQNSVDQSHERCPGRSMFTGELGTQFFLQYFQNDLVDLLFHRNEYEQPLERNNNQMKN